MRTLVKSGAAGRTFALISPILMLLGLASSEAAGPTRLIKPMASVFGKPGGPPAPVNGILKRSHADYRALHECATAADPATADAKCGAVGVPKFFEFGTHAPGAALTNNPQAFEIVNRCHALRPGFRADIGEVTFPDSGTVACPADGDNIVVSHLVACYGKGGSFGAGAFCQLATLCFEPEPIRGRCIRDYPAKEIPLMYAGTPGMSPGPGPASPSPSPSAPVIKCYAEWCHLGSSLTAICYTDGSNTPPEAGSGTNAAGESCTLTENGGSASSACQSPTLCSPGDPSAPK